MAHLFWPAPKAIPKGKRGQNIEFDMVFTANCLEQVPDLFLKNVKELFRVSSTIINSQDSSP